MWTLQHEKREAMRVLGAAGVPCSYVFDTMDLFNDEHLQAREFVQTVDHPVSGPIKLLRHPLRMPGVEPMTRAPMLGEHTDEVLAEYLGIDEATLVDMREQGVTKTRT